MLLTTLLLNDLETGLVELEGAKAGWGGGGGWGHNIHSVINP